MDGGNYFHDYAGHHTIRRVARAPRLFDSQPTRISSRAEVWLGVIVVALATLMALCGSYGLPLAIITLVGTTAIVLAIRYCLREPSWLLFALALEEVLPYLNVIPLDPDSRWVLRYPLLLPLCIPAAWMAFRSGLFWRGWYKAYTLFFLWCLITIGYSLAPGTSAGRLLPCVLIYGTLLVVSSSVNSADDVQKLLGRFLYGCEALIVLVGVAYFTFSVDLTWMQEQGLDRFTGIFSEPNDLGALTLATMCVGMAHWRATSGRGRVFLAFVIALSLWFTVMADSRTIVLAFGVGCLSYTVWKKGVRGVAIVAVAMMLLVGIVSMLGENSMAYLNRDVATATGRTEAWHFELGKIKQAPLTGYGYDVEGQIFQDKFFTNWEDFWDGGPNTPLHSGYLGIAVGVGVPALAAWLIIMVSPWIWLMRSKHDPWQIKPLFFFIVVPMLIVGIGESGVGEPRYLKGVLFFLSWMIVERYRQITVASPAQVEQESSARISPLAAALSACLIGALAIGLWPGRALAADYYVDATGGNDGASGTAENSAWRTVGMVNPYPFRPGDVVHFKRGATWRETLRPLGSHDGNFKDVTFTAYGAGDPPTINGSDVIDKWRRESGSVYSATEASAVYNVFFNQSPGWGLKHACCMPGAACNADDVEAHQRGHTCEIGAMTAGSWYWSGVEPIAPARPNTLYVWLSDGSDPASGQLEAVTREFGFIGWTRGHQLDGIVIDGLRIVQAGQRAITLESEDRAGCCGSLETGDGIKGIVIRNCVIARTGTGKFDDGSYGNAISIINATAPLVENNVVSYAGNHGNAIQVQNANGARVIGNTVDHWNHNGIDIKGSRDVIVQNNLARDQIHTGAGFYTENSAKVLFAHNRVERVSNGFQISEGASAIVLENNLTDADTGIYFGPKAIALTVASNVARATHIALQGDGNGALRQVSNDWGSHPLIMIPGVR